MSKRKAVTFTVVITAVFGFTLLRHGRLLLAQHEKLSKLMITTDELLNPTVGRPYTIVFSARGGSKPYKWNIEGDLPARAVLDARRGRLYFTPIRKGDLFLTVTVQDGANATSVKNLHMQVAEDTSDSYGGSSANPCPGGKQPRFYTAKIGDRWHLCTPAGNAFWMNAVYHVDASDNGVDHQGIALANVITQKYAVGPTSNATLNWALQSLRRLQSWGFNSLAEDAVSWVTPVAVHSSWQSADNTIPLKFPYVAIAAPSWYSLTNTKNYAEGPVKDLIAGVKLSVFKDYRSQSADFWDPNFATWFKADLTQDFWPHYYLTGPHSDYLISMTVDDTDFLQGFGAGRDFPTTNNGVIARGYDQPHLGWIVLVTAPTQTSNEKLSVTYPDTTVHAKRALSAFLSAKYEGDVRRLNSAWGAHYKGFGSAGGWGRGNGLLDEDGTCPAANGGACWVPRDAYALAGATPAMSQDLDTFLFRHAQQYFCTIQSILRSVAPGVMYSGPTVLGTFGAPPRRQILQAAARYVDVYTLGTIPPVCTDCTDIQDRIDFIARHGGDKPWVSWEGYWAEADSYMSQFAASKDQTMLQTQASRGQLYQQRMELLLSTRDSATSIYHVVGLKWWELYDNRGESANWGLITRRDNPYDGASATASPGTDPWGYPTGCSPSFGCERQDYGDFLSLVASANFSALRFVSGKPARQVYVRDPKK